MRSKEKESNIKGFTIRENLVMTPIEKHIYYNKYPWRLLFNIFLVALVTAQVYFIFDYDSSYSRQEQRTFNYLFLGQTDDHTPVSIFNSPIDLQNHLTTVQSAYQNFGDNMFQDIDMDQAQFFIQSNYRKNPYGRNENMQVDMVGGFTDPFDISSINSIKNYMEGVIQFQIVAQNLLLTTQPNQQNVPVCQNWTIILQYDLQQFTQVLTSISSFSSLCSVDSNNGYNATLTVIVSFLVLILAVSSFIMSIQKINKVSAVFIRMKASYINYMNHNTARDSQALNEQVHELADAAESPNAHQNITRYLKYTSWEEIPIGAKMKFFSPWFFFNIIGNVLQIISSLSIIFAFSTLTGIQDFYVVNASLGFSAFFTWSQPLQYLAFWKDVTSVTTTLAKAGPNIGVYFGVCLPLFFGVAILGYSLFWKYDKFTSVGMSLRSLFAMAGGDIVHETYTDTWDEGIISTIFFTIFMIAFFTAFVNIFVAVIMEGYDRGKKRKELDNDDPFPELHNTVPLKEKLNSEMTNSGQKSDINSLTDTGYDLKAKLEKELSKPDLDANTKNVINLLLFYVSQAKLNLAELLEAKKRIETIQDDKTGLRFLQELMANSFNKIMDQIFYLRIALKKGPRKQQKGF